MLPTPTPGREARWTAGAYGREPVAERNSFSQATRNILKHTRHMGFWKKTEVFHNKNRTKWTMSAEQSLNWKWVLALNVNIQYAPQMDFIFKPYPNQKVSETNKASENGIEAKMYINNGEFGYKQTGREKHPLPPIFCFHAAQADHRTHLQFCDLNTLSSV